MNLDGGVHQEVVQNNVKTTRKSMDLDGGTLQKVDQNNVKSTHKSMDLDGGTLQKVDRSGPVDERGWGARWWLAGRALTLGA